MKRSIFEQVIALFRSIREHPKDSCYWICMRTGINYTRAYKLLHHFNDKGFLTFQLKERGRKSSVRLTQKGSEWLSCISGLMDDIGIEEICENLTK